MHAPLSYLVEKKGSKTLPVCYSMIFFFFLFSFHSNTTQLSKEHMQHSFTNAESGGDAERVRIKDGETGENWALTKLRTGGVRKLGSHQKLHTRRH